MSAFLQSGRSDHRKSSEMWVRFRPKADVDGKPHKSTYKHFLMCFRAYFSKKYFALSDGAVYSGIGSIQQKRTLGTGPRSSIRSSASAGPSGHFLEWPRCLHLLDELVEPWVHAHWIEIGIPLEPAPVGMPRVVGFFKKVERVLDPTGL